FIANANQVMPLIVGHYAAAGHVRAAASITHEETEGVAASAAVEIELFAAAAVAFGDQPGIGGLRAATDPSFHGKHCVANAGKGNENVGYTTIARRERSEASGRVNVQQ